jgi:DNA-binding TFAR19-related protein (PDSD5 family)
MALGSGGFSERLEEDHELKLIEQRKLAEMRRRMKPPEPPKAEKTDRETVESLLYDRGDEVLVSAYSFYPKQTEQIVKELARLIREGKFSGRISGGELYSLFRQIGLRFQLKTSIKVQERGKFVDLSEKLKLKRGDE